MSVISAIGTIKKTVVYIYSVDAREEHRTLVHPLGTGFFVAVPHHEAEGKIFPYFVTAKHVLKSSPEEYRREILLRSNLKNWSPSSNQIGVRFDILPVLDDNRNLVWTVHSNPAVDIAVIQTFPRREICDFGVVPHTAFARARARVS